MIVSQLVLLKTELECVLTAKLTARHFSAWNWEIENDLTSLLTLSEKRKGNK